MSATRIWIAGAVIAAVAGAALLSGPSSAAQNKTLQDQVDKIAAVLQKGDKEGANKEAAVLGKKLNEDEFAEAMGLFKPRKKGGFGMGDKPGSVNPDGIEQMLLKIARDAPTAGALKKDGEALEQMGYRIAALGMLAKAKGPPQVGGNKTLKDWTTWASDAVDGGLAVAAAAKAKGAQDVKSAASKLNSACNSCHTVFR